MTPRLPEATWPTRAAFIAALAIIGFTMSYLIWMYVELPFAVPVRFIRERPIIHAFKSPLLVMLPVLVQLALVGFIGPLVALLLWRTHPSAVADEDAQRMKLVAEGVALIGCVWIAVQAASAVRLVALWERGGGGFGEIYTFVLVTAVVLSIVISARTLAVLSTRRPPTVDDPAVWRLRHLYFNRRNPALFVPARSGSGYTLNFGRPLAVAGMAAMLCFGVIAPYYVAFNVLTGYWQ